MITFKDFMLIERVQLAPLVEDIFAKGDELFAAVNDSTARRPSTDDVISTNLRPLGRQSGTTRGIPVYYSFNYRSSDATTELLKSLKGKGKYHISDERRSKFIKHCAAHMAGEFKKMKLVPDVIVTPQSSSTMLKEFAEALADGLGVEARKIGAFKKAPMIDLPEDREEALKAIEAKYFDRERFEAEYKKEDPKQRAKDVRDLLSSILRSIKKNGHIVAKELYKPMSKFVKNLVDSDLHGDDEYSLMDKRVLVVDDVLSSGTTMTDVFRACKDLLAAEVYGAVMFARTSS